MNRVLIVKLGALGDVVHAIPVAAALRRAFPSARIDWLVGAKHRAILDLVPVIADLAKMPDDYARTHLLTISFDPKYDTPEVPRKYGLAYLHDDASGFSHWDFASTAPDKMEKLAATFGLSYLEEDNQITHSMSIVLIAPDGTVSKYWTNEWTASELEDALRQAAHGV